jgi:syntaxin 16
MDIIEFLYFLQVINFNHNATVSKYIFVCSQQMTDRMALVGADAESGLELRRAGESRMPPAWTDGLEEAQYSMTRLRSKIHDLDTLHTRHLHRPTLDDSSDEEQQIEALTQEITRVRLVSYVTVSSRKSK